MEDRVHLHVSTDSCQKQLITLNQISNLSVIHLTATAPMSLTPVDISGNLLIAPVLTPVDLSGNLLIAPVLTPLDLSGNLLIAPVLTPAF